MKNLILGLSIFVFQTAHAQNNLRNLWFQNLIQCDLLESTDTLLSDGKLPKTFNLKVIESLKDDTGVISIKLRPNPSNGFCDSASVTITKDIQGRILGVTFVQPKSPDVPFTDTYTYGDNGNVVLSQELRGKYVDYDRTACQKFQKHLNAIDKTCNDAVGLLMDDVADEKKRLKADGKDFGDWMTVVERKNRNSPFPAYGPVISVFGFCQLHDRSVTPSSSVKVQNENRVGIAR